VRKEQDPTLRGSSHALEYRRHPTKPLRRSSTDASPSRRPSTAQGYRLPVTAQVRSRATRPRDVPPSPGIPWLAWPASTAVSASCPSRRRASTPG